MRSSLSCFELMYRWPSAHSPEIDVLFCWFYFLLRLTSKYLIDLFSTQNISNSMNKNIRYFLKINRSSVKRSEIIGVVTFKNAQGSASFFSSRNNLSHYGVRYHLVNLAGPFWKRLIKTMLGWPGAEKTRFPILAVLLPDVSFFMVKPATALLATPLELSIALLICRIRRIRIGLIYGNCRSNFIRLEERLPKWKVVLGRFILRRIHLQLAPTPQCASDAKKHFNIITPRVINNTPFIQGDTKAKRVPSDPPIFVNLASAQHRKGSDLFVEIAIRVLDKNPNCFFEWYGGEVPEALAVKISAAGYSNKINFIDYTDCPVNVLDRASGLLFTSRSEAFGQTVAEALARSRTVFHFSGTGAAWVVGSTGVSCRRFDVDSMAERIVEYSFLPASERVNTLAKDRFEAKFSAEAFAQKFASVVLRDTPRPKKGSR